MLGDHSNRLIKSAKIQFSKLYSIVTTMGGVMKSRRQTVVAAAATRFRSARVTTVKVG
jgi:hypothetical protein